VAGENRSLRVFTVDNGVAREDPSYVVVPEADGKTYSGYRWRRGEKARFRSALAVVDTGKAETLLFKTGTGNEPLPRPFRRVDHEQVRGTASDAPGNITPEGVVAVTALIDLLR
jgi:hypothetical protein